MKNYKVIIFSIVLVSLILGIDFFTKSGFFVFLDTTFFPVHELKGFFSQSLFWHLRDLLNIIFGYELYSKLFILFVLLTGVFCGYKIANFIINIYEIKNKNIDFLIKTTSIIFTLSIPFIYERLVSQAGIALGVFFIGIGFIYLLEYTFVEQNKKLYLSSLFFALSLTVFPHSIVFIVIIGIITLLFFFKKFSFKNIVFSFLIFLFINLNWIIGTFFLDSVENGVKTTVLTFNQQNIEVFTQNSLSGLGVEITSLFTYGFWGEKYGHLLSTELVNKYFWIYGVIIFIFIGIGFCSLWKKEKKLSIYLFFIFIISYILSLGISSTLFSGLNQFLYDNIPYYIGMREPGKLLGLVSIVYILFFSIGVYIVGLSLYKIAFEIKKSDTNLYIYILFIFFLVSAFNPNMLFGFKGQLKFFHYPKSYFDSKLYLEEKKEFRNLIFPWHSYISCKWSNNNLSSNVYPNILNFSDTIKADNIEIDGLYTNYNNPVSKKIENFLKTKDINILISLGIQNIIFQDNCADFEKYKFLDELNGLKKVFDKKYLKIYKIIINE